MTDDPSQLNDPLDAPAGSVDLIDPEAVGPIPSATVAAVARPPLDKRERRKRADREILGLAWPAILSQALASAVSLIDIAMLGRLGTDALAAVGFATQFFFLAQSVLMAMGISQVAIMSRALGAGDSEYARRAMAVFLTMGVVYAILIASTVAIAPRELILALNATPEIATLAVPYFVLTLGSTSLFAVALTFENGFRAAKNTSTPMKIAFVVTGVKLALNGLLIFGTFGFPRLELAGAGWATVGSQAVGMVVFVLVARRGPSSAVLRFRRADLWGNRALFREALRISGPAMAERLFMNLALMTYFWLLGEYGPVAIAAYTVGVRILSFSWIPGTGFSIAASTLVGQALGAGERRTAVRAGWRAARLGLIVSVVLGIAFALAREPLGRLFIDDPAVIDALGPFMLTLALAQPLMGVHFTLGGALRGAGDTVSPLFAAIVGNWGLRVPIAAVAALVFEADVVWLWSGLAFDHLARAAWMTLRFYREGWAEQLGTGAGARAG